ncbi:KpsF/GutQ family sugar-phosphate isomerase [Tepidimonas charontis]|uniref:Arabinose 5-phosphate isomerase KdsD n=1 Tax=Tepidimonas charontis TaxID=2267262 RepID=A0A554XDJ9_9BURK|nr:KpsF/GutQ family sugar-phosphate isomerase [Tepidimonas charontis]TSE33903.1 Arabinose 5-phosphate isomerase KdsD [Tepidimonas charontis]
MPQPHVPTEAHSAAAATPASAAPTPAPAAATNIPAPNAAGLAAPLHTAADDDDALLAHGRQALAIEIEGLQALAARLDGRFARAVRTLLHCRGRVVVTGMGKSGHVGRKIAATLASTGTPALFMHPAEASHGDLGMITPSDAVLAISNSGESDELTAIVPLIKRMGVPLVAMTGRTDSTLARHADIVLDTAVAREACPLNLAPTASTTAQLAMGDALAVALLSARGFQPDDFARSHPGGALGRRLLTLVRDVMRPLAATPRVPPHATLTEVMREMSAKGLGATAVVNAAGRPIGIFTDGDLRRLIERHVGEDLRCLTAQAIMHPDPRTVRPGMLAVEAAALMEQHRITSVLVVDDDGGLVGALNHHDLMRAKVI